MFKQRLWMIPAAQWVGLASAVFCVFAVANGAAAAWLLLWAVGHICGSLAVSVGLHRYFTHGAFTTSRLWHWVMALWATLTLQGSPLGWTAAHMTHHVHSDKDGDPHFTGWSYLLFKQYRPVRMVMWRTKHLVKDSAVAFTHRYALLVVAGWVSALGLLGLLTGTGAAPLVFGYLAPLGTTHLIGAIHQVTSHRGQPGGKDMTVMEWLFPAMGEWQHKRHHDHPREWRYGTRWYHLDLGSVLIRAIKS